MVNDFKWQINYVETINCSQRLGKSNIISSDISPIDNV